MKKIMLAMIAVVSVSLSGCYVNLTGPAPHLSVPLTAEKASRKGEATCTQILWAFFLGDCSIKTAMRNGGVSKIHHVDGDLRVLFYGAFSEARIKVYGE